MSTRLAHPPPKTRLEPSQERINNRVREAFERLPLLIAFSLDDDLSYADIEVHPWPCSTWHDDVYNDIDEKISTLIQELTRAGSAELLRGRTFARALQ